jgi:hypothetical protein
VIALAIKEDLRLRILLSQGALSEGAYALQATQAHP